VKTDPSAVGAALGAAVGSSADQDTHMEMPPPRDMIGDVGVTFHSLIARGLQAAIAYADGIDQAAVLGLRSGAGAGAVADTTGTVCSSSSSRTSRSLPWAPRGETEALVITDHEGIILYTNRAWSRLCGFSNDDVVGRTSKILQGPQSDPDTVWCLNEALMSGLPAHAQIVNYRKSGTAFVNDFEVLPIYNWHGAVGEDGTQGASPDTNMKVWNPALSPLGPSHFVARLNVTPDREDLPSLTESQMALRDESDALLAASG